MKEKRIFLLGEPDAFANYREVLAFCGGIPVVSKELSQLQSCDGLLIPGGGDIDPSFYHAALDGSRDIDKSRDRQELLLVEKARQQKKPILGICRGIQIINVALGGTLIQDLPTAARHQWTQTLGDQVHNVQTHKNSFLQPLYGPCFSVNSAHHQAIKELGAGLTSVAQSDDDVIEAVECPEESIFGIQWHPERLTMNRLRTDAVDGIKIFQFFLQQIN